MTGFEVVDHKGLKALGIRYCKVHLSRLEAAGAFPRSFKLREFHNSPRVWKLADVLEWLKSRST
jgi:hypothetical protein